MSDSRFRRRDVLRLGMVAGMAGILPRRFAYPSTIPKLQSDSPEVFVGPFSSWKNLQDYGAIGSGIIDDTAALQAALDDLGANDTSPVLWIPAGTYRITKTLTWTRNIGDNWMSILGEHPAATRIVWDGAPGGTMFQTHNINNSRFGRITWDGAGRAGCAIQHTSSGSSSGNEHADEVFQNVGIGIRGGTMDTQMVAEMSVLRCHFVQCSRAGISLENPNSLDWWIWNSSFEDCYVGVTSGYGQGGFHVFNSVFRRSSFADTFIGFATYHVLADNYSIHSRAFCLAPFSLNPIELVIQRNIILDPLLGPNPPDPNDGGLSKLFPYELQSPITVKYYGPMLLLDNIIRSRPNQTGPVVEVGEDLIAVGNAFTVPNALKAGKRLLEFDNSRVDARLLNVLDPVLPAAPRKFEIGFAEAAPGASASEIQTIIDFAPQNGKGHVIHLPYGTYTLDKTLNIPASSDLQLVGDGRTFLDWSAGEGTAIALGGPAQVTLRDIVVRQNGNKGVGLSVTNCDQPDARIFMQGVQAHGFTHTLLADGLDFARVELRDFQNTNLNFDVPISSERTAIQVNGGAGTGRVNWFSGASSGMMPTFGVAEGGALLARAIWYEGSASQVAHFTDSGEFTFLGGLFARAGSTNPAAPLIEVDNFRGQVALLSVSFADSGDLSNEFSQLRVRGDKDALRVLLLGSGGWTGRLMSFINEARKGQVAFLLNRSAQTVGDSVLARPDEYLGQEPAPYRQFLKSMLAAARSEKPGALTTLPSDVTDLRLYRVYVLDFDTAIRIVG